MDNSAINSELTVLAASAEWRHLTAKRKIWLTAYLTNGGNILAATQQAYPDASAKSQAVMGHQLLRAQDIIDTLEVWKWRAENVRTQLLSQAEYNLARSEPGTSQAQRLLTQIERLHFGIRGTNRGRFEDPDEDLEEDIVEPIAEPQPPIEQSADKRIPKGAQVWYDNASGAAIGYRFDGRDVPLS